MNSSNIYFPQILEQKTAQIGSPNIEWNELLLDLWEGNLSLCIHTNFLSTPNLTQHYKVAFKNGFQIKELQEHVFFKRLEFIISQALLTGQFISVYFMQSR